jgi:hypothetical protein
MESIFTYIYENKIWGGTSGDGSTIEYNISDYIPFLKNFIIDNNIKTVVDIGCGDFQCGEQIYNELDILYTGYEAYLKLIE